MNRRGLVAASRRMHAIAVLAALLAVASLALAGQQGFAEPAEPAAEPVRQRRAEPSKQQQTDAERTIKEVYKAEYGNPAGRAGLPEKLLEQAGQSADDAATQFVLLREARDLAVASGDFATAGRAVEALAERFRVDANQMKAGLLTSAARSARSPEAARSAVALALGLIEDAVLRDEYKAADQYAGAARELAKRTKDKSVMSAVRDRGVELRSLAREFGKVRAAREKLADDPDDPAANLLVGRYLCLTKGEWDEGLPLLAKGADPALRDLARLELAQPSAAPSMAKVADAWWAIAEKAAGHARSAARARAAHWYQEAEPNLTGIKRDLAAARIAEARAPTVAAGTGRTPAGVPLLRLVDAKRDAVAGVWQHDRAELISAPQGGTRIEFPYLPPEEYDFRIEFSY